MVCGVWCVWCVWCVCVGCVVCVRVCEQSINHISVKNSMLRRVSLIPRTVWNETNRESSKMAGQYQLGLVSRTGDEQCWLQRQSRDWPQIYRVTCSQTFAFTIIHDWQRMGKAWEQGYTRQSRD